MLLRPGDIATGYGFEVYMLRRKPTMAFAPGAYVFPGGSVDASRDADEEVAWKQAPDAAKWGQALDAPPRNWPERWSAPRSGRRSKSAVCCWPGRPEDTVVADTTVGR